VLPSVDRLSLDAGFDALLKRDDVIAFLESLQGLGLHLIVELPVGPNLKQ